MGRHHSTELLMAKAGQGHVDKVLLSPRECIAEIPLGEKDGVAGFVNLVRLTLVKIRSKSNENLIAVLVCRMKINEPILMDPIDFPNT